MSYLSALKFHCKSNSLEDRALATPKVRAALKGISNLEVDRPAAQTGCTIKQLRTMCEQANIVYSDFEAKLVSAVFRIAFFGFLRVSEYALTSSKHQLSVDDCSIVDNALMLRIPSSKTSRRPTSIILRPNSDKTLCPVLAYKKYLKVRPNRAHNQLFLSSNGNQLRAVQVSQYLKTLSAVPGSQLLTSHCFRIGGATWAAQSGWSDANIRAHGRWSSDAFLHDS